MGSVFLQAAAGIRTDNLTGYQTSAVRSHSITATYADDSNFNPSTSAALIQVVSKADTTTALVSSVNPTRFGQSTTFTATVSVVAPGTTLVAPPTGTVNFFDGGISIGSGSLTTTTA